MATTPSLTYARRPVEWSAARTLLGDYVEWLRGNVTTDVPEDYWQALDDEIDDLPVHFAEPNRLLVAWVGPVPVGTLGARHHDDATGARVELTRFYVRPIARGRGIAEVLLGTMLAELGRAGYASVSLETAPQDMPAAHRLYRRFGFEEVECSTACDGVVCMTLDLDRLPGGRPAATHDRIGRGAA